MVNKILNISLATKIIKKLDHYTYSFQKWVHIEVLIKKIVCISWQKKVFDKYNEIWEKVSNIVTTKFNSELVYNKKYIKAGNKINTKESFQCIYERVILIESVF